MTGTSSNQWNVGIGQLCAPPWPAQGTAERHAWVADLAGIKDGKPRN